MLLRNDIQGCLQESVAYLSNDDEFISYTL